MIVRFHAEGDVLVVSDFIVVVNGSKVEIIDANGEKRRALSLPPNHRFLSCDAKAEFFATENDDGLTIFRNDEKIFEIPYTCADIFLFLKDKFYFAGHAKSALYAFSEEGIHKLWSLPRFKTAFFSRASDVFVARNDEDKLCVYRADTRELIEVLWQEKVSRFVVNDNFSVVAMQNMAGRLLVSGLAASNRAIRIFDEVPRFVTFVGFHPDLCYLYDGALFSVNAKQEIKCLGTIEGKVLFRGQSILDLVSSS